MAQARTITLFLLRVVTGFLFLQHGGMKLFGWFGGMPPDGSTAALASQAGIGGLIELVCGTLVMIGLGTRPAAFLASGTMAVAYFQFHQPGGLLPIQNHGEPAVLFCFLFLFFAAWGGGEWSVDAALARRPAVPR